jgi:DNA polymerase III sliding clamp (beta) subunit (PCNA family)
MSANKMTIDRETLIKITGLVRPSLSSQAYIPALQTIKFADGWATAYNDISAISVRCDIDIERCLPGETLIRALGSFGAKEVMLQPAGEDKDSGMILSSGRSKIKMPTQVVEDFPLEWPEVTKNTPEIVITDSMIKGISTCLLSVGTDPTHPAQMGVTLDADDKGKALLFSTDNFSISRYQTDSKISLPGDSPVILPRFFCEQLLTLAKAFPNDEIAVLLHPGALAVEIGKQAKLFTKTVVDLEPLDFHQIINKNCKVASIKDQLTSIPDAFDAALSRALLVLGNETDKATKVVISDNNFNMASTSQMGEAVDTLPFEGTMDDCPNDAFHFDPMLVARGAKACALMGFSRKVLIMADADAKFIHMVAYCSQ